VDDALFFRIAVRPRGDGIFLSLSSRGGKFEDAKRPKIGDAAYPYTRPKRLRVHALLLTPTRKAPLAAISSPPREFVPPFETRD